MEVQNHGVQFENEVIQAITGLDKEQYQSLLVNSYTASMDIKNGVHSDRDYSIKVSKEGKSVGCGDIIRFTQHCLDDEFTMVIGAWKQSTTTKKTYYEVYEFDIKPTDYDKLWGSKTITSALASFVKYVKSIPEGKKAQMENRTKWKDIRDAIYKEHGQGIMKIDAKIDSKNQRRVQCSVKVTDLIDAGIQYRKFVDNYRGIVLPYQQDSKARTFNG